MEFRKIVPEESPSSPRRDFERINALQNDNRIRLLAAATGLLAIAAPLFAQSPAADDLPTKVAALEASVKTAQSAGDNGWMLVSAALVLMMAGAGLALFYGGLVRRKNVLATMMQSFILMAIITVLWAVVGYSLAFGG